MIRTHVRAASIDDGYLALVNNTNTTIENDANRCLRFRVYSMDTILCLAIDCYNSTSGRAYQPSTRQ